MYNRTTVQGATFNLRGQLYCGHANATALFSSPVVSALGSKLDNPGSSPGQGKVLRSWDMRGKKMRAPLLGLAKSIYYLAREREEWIWILLKLELFQASFLFSAGISSLVIPFPSGHGDHNLCILVWCRTATSASFDISFFCLILVQEWRLLLSVCHWRL